MKLKLSEIKPNPDNPRLIKDDKFKKLVNSIKEFPEMAEVREIVVNKDHMILGGNMRFKAMQEAGWKEVPVRVVDWPEDKQKQFIIKDNVSGGEWDWDVLANQWDSDLLDDWGLDVPAGFGEEEVVEDEAPAVADVAISKLGEIYQLGKHRLMCGDSTDFGQVSDLMDGEQADMVFTDPPYGVDYEGGSKKWDKLEGDTKGFERFYEAVAQAKDFTKDKACFYICFAGMKSREVFTALEGLTLKNIIIWAKNNAQFGMLGANYHQKHEPIMFAINGKSYNWYGPKNEVTIWEIDRANKNDYHSTQKPIALVARALKNSSQKDNLILDLFGGGGSTLIACEQLDRTCYMMELDPKYCDVIRKRYWKFINKDNDDGWEEGTNVIT